jgi:hypothetical protein
VNTTVRLVAPRNTIMMAERIGERVRICFLGGPEADEACDPKTDMHRHARK